MDEHQSIDTSNWPAVDRIDWEKIGLRYHEALEQLLVPEIKRQLELAEFGQSAQLFASDVAKATLEVLVIVMRDHLEMREKNEPERWAREVLGL